MKTLSRLLAAASVPVVLSFAAACGGSADADAEKFSALADEACKCKDEACFEKLEAKWEKLEDEMRDKYKGKDVSKEDMESARKIVQAAENKIEACMEKAEKAAGGN